MDNPKTITLLSWFSGFGGLELGIRAVVGKPLRTVAYCEREGYACANLVAKIEGGLLDAAPIWTDCRTFPLEQFSGLVDIFTAGYPCQGFSAAGKREGQKDPRFLWPWVMRAVAVIQPRYCLFENVDGHVTLGLSTVISDLEAAGYRVKEGIFSAAEVGASHRRKRVFILAESKHNAGSAKQWVESWQRTNEGPHDRPMPWPSGANVANATLRGLGIVRESSRSDRQLDGCDEALADSAGERSREAGRVRRDGPANGIAGSGIDMADSDRRQQPRRSTERSTEVGGGSCDELAGSGPELADTDISRPQGRHGGELRECAGQRTAWTCSSQLPEFPPGPTDIEGWRRVLEIDPTLEPALCRLADGRPSRVDELRLAGNGVVWQTAAKAFAALLGKLTP